MPPLRTLFVVHGPAEPHVPLVLDSPHSGFDVPGRLRRPAQRVRPARGRGLLRRRALPAGDRARRRPDRGARAAHLHRPQPARRRHRPRPDRGRPLARRARAERQGAPRQGAGLAHPRRRPRRSTTASSPVDEVRRRIERYHRPYHDAVRERIEATHARFGRSWHINCHSMNAVARRAGRRRRRPRRAPTSSSATATARPATRSFTELVRGVLAGMGYDVRVNDPYKGVELVRAYSNPAGRRMSLQLEINKRLYMDEATRTRHAGFATVQRQLATLIDAVLEYTRERTVARRGVSEKAQTSPAGARPAEAQRRLDDAAEHGQGRPHDALGQSVHVAECGSAAVAVAQHGALDARRDRRRRAGRSRRRRRRSAPPWAGATSPAGAGSASPATRTCCCDRQRRLSVAGDREAVASGRAGDISEMRTIIIYDGRLRRLARLALLVP